MYPLTWKRSILYTESDFSPLRCPLPRPSSTTSISDLCAESIGPALDILAVERRASIGGALDNDGAATAIGAGPARKHVVGWVTVPVDIGFHHGGAGARHEEVLARALQVTIVARLSAAAAGITVELRVEQIGLLGKDSGAGRGQGEGGYDGDKRELHFE